MMLAVGVLKGQTALLSTIEAPYPAVQSPVKIAGASYGAGAVAYGPVGTPLILSGKNFGAMGTVLFPGPQKGTTVAATVTSWSSSILFLKVPAGATTGLVYVSNGAKQSNGLPFIVTQGNYTGSCPAFPPANQLEITTASLPNGRLGQSYGVTLNAEGGAPPYSWSLSGGSLPAGLSLGSSSGVISGTPTTVTGEVNLRLKATDSQGQSTEAMLSMAVDSQLLTAGTIYSYTVGADGYDGTGNVTSYTDTVMGKWSFGYDGLSRLMSAIPGTGVPDSYVGQNLCMNYDAFGNQTQASFQQSVCNPTSDAATTSYAANNQISWTAKNSVGTNTHYDTAGNVAYDGNNYYAYDGEGRICAMQSSLYGGGYSAYAYIYDAEGRRVAKGTITPIDPKTQPLTCSMQGFQLTESYTLGAGGEQLTVSGGDGSWKWTNVYGAGKLIATYDINGEHYQLSDPLGTRRMQTSSNGEAELACQSLPFGDQQYCYTVPNAPPTADDATSLHFTGKERDEESGNDYFGARYYASSMGRMLSPDPLFISPERLFDPQLLNLYSYVRNNPLSLIDPTGLDFYLSCQHSDSNSDTCQQVQNGDRKVWVQGQMVDGQFQAADVDMNEQGDPSAGYSDQFGNNYTGTFNESGGVSFTNAATGATSGGSVFIEGSDPTQVSGSGAFSGITGNFFNACGGSCQARGTLSGGTRDDWKNMKDSLVKSSAFKSLLDGLSMAHPLISQQWKDANGYAHLIKAPGDIMDMHFEGASTGAGLQGFILHTVSTIKDMANGNAAHQRSLMTKGTDPDE